MMHPSDCRCSGTGEIEAGPAGATYSMPCDEVSRLREALRFYADRGTYRITDSGVDHGEVARAALRAASPEDEKS